jgi:hypothetical protein
MFLSGGDYYPRKWANMSLDMRLFFVLFAGSMPLFMLGGSGAVPGVVQMAIEGAGLMLVTGISVAHRRREGWRWRGAGMAQVFGAVLSLGASGLMIFVSLPAMGDQVPRLATWLSMVALIGAFNALASLGIIRQSRDAFAADCRGDAAPGSAMAPSGIVEAGGGRWRVWVRRIWVGCFITVWLSGMASFYFRGRSVQGAATQTTPMVDHAMRSAGLSPDSLGGLLPAISFGGTFAVLISGFLLHYVLRIRVLPNVPLPGEPKR